MSSSRAETESDGAAGGPRGAPSPRGDRGRAGHAAGGGDAESAGVAAPAAGTDELFPVVYEELRGLAHARMTHERRGHSLQTTALVHEVYVRLQKDPDVRWNSPAHFFGAAAESMRRILIERARRRLSLKRGGDRGRSALDSAEEALSIDDGTSAQGMLDLDAALGELESHDAGLAQVVKFRYFAGLTVDETATALGRSPRSVKRDWAFARAWLANRLHGE